MSISTKKNKKRNSGLLYEFLVATISKSLVEGDQGTANVALGILKKHFKQGTEIYKEWRLVNSLMKVSVSNQNVAASILSEAKLAARSHNELNLDREKSVLIKEINHRLNGDGTFWDQSIEKYKMYATIQTLINDWKIPGSAPLEQLAEYEDRLTRWITEEREKPEIKEELAGSVGENRLVLKLMMKKLNEKYGCSLTSNQKGVLREYVFTTSTGKDVEKLKQTLSEVKLSAITAIENYENSDSSNKYVLNKLKEAKESIDAETLNEVNDGVITRFMLYMKLVSELEAKENS